MEEQKDTTENAENVAQKQRVIGRPFQPGQSGNPKGKKPGTISITSEIKKQLQKRDPETRKTFLEILVKRIMLKAIKDQDVPTIKAIWAYIDGCPVQRNELTGKDGTDLPVIVNMIPAKSLNGGDDPPVSQNE